MNTIEELKECLVLQNQIDELTLQLFSRYKAVIEAERTKGNSRTIHVELDGQMYALEREEFDKSSYREAMAYVHKLEGFWMYRLFKKGTVIK